MLIEDRILSEIPSLTELLVGNRGFSQRHMWSFAVACGHLWSIVVICGHLWSIVGNCGQLRPIVINCGQLCSHFGQLWSIVVNYDQ